MADSVPVIGRDLVVGMSLLVPGGFRAVAVVLALLGERDGGPPSLAAEAAVDEVAAAGNLVGRVGDFGLG